MADFPAHQKNAQVQTKPLTIDAPANEAGDTAEQRWIKQQWRDVEAQGIGATHPLSLNRDSDYVTADPYDTP